MALRTGRKTGAKAYEAARKAGIFAAAPSGLAIGTPANGGLGRAAVFHERMNRADDMVAPWDGPRGYLANAYTNLRDCAQSGGMHELRDAENQFRKFAYLYARSQNEPGVENWGHWVKTADRFDDNCGLTPIDEWRIMFQGILCRRQVRRMYPPQDIVIEIVKPVVRIQDLQDPSDTLGAAALTKAPVQTDELTTLWNAIMANLGHDGIAVRLDNGYGLTFNKLTANLHHPGNKNPLVVGSKLTDDEPMRPVFRREELRAFMDKVKHGQKPMKHGALATLNETPVTATPVASQKVALASGPLFCLRDYPAGWTRPEWCDLTNIGNEKTPVMVEGL